MSARFFVFFTLGACAWAQAASAADGEAERFAPKVAEVNRYAGIWKRSPFITETVAVQVSAGLATKYALVGIASLGNQPIVFLVDRNNGDVAKNRLLVRKGKPSAEGIELVSVAMETDPRKSSAVIRQAGQEATLPFDSTAMGPTGPNSQPGSVPPTPSAMVNPPPGAATVPGMLPSGTSLNPSNPTNNIPPPATRRIIRPAPINLSN